MELDRTELIEYKEYQKHSDGIILEGFRGSQAHGTFVQGHPDSTDDVDLMGIKISSLDHYFGLKHFETAEVKYNKWDVVIYDIKKFMSLLVKQNPNVISLLWLEDEFYTKRTVLGDMLISERDKLLSKQIYNSFTGYAYSQLHKMTHFQAYEGYMGAKRKNLVDKYGYDSKNACHLIRLLEMGIEALETGSLVVKRPNAQTLIDIKYGQWKLQDVQDLANKLFSKAEDALKNSKLPEKVDADQASRLCVHILEGFFNPPNLHWFGWYKIGVDRGIDKS